MGWDEADEGRGRGTRHRDCKDAAAQPRWRRGTGAAIHSDLSADRTLWGGQRKEGTVAEMQEASGFGLSEKHVSEQGFTEQGHSGQRGK